MKTEWKVGYICTEILTKFAVVITAIDEQTETMFFMFPDGSNMQMDLEVFERDYKFTGNTCQSELLEVLGKVKEQERD